MTVGPCQWNIDLTCCTEWSSYTPAVTGAAFDYATSILWAATGRRFGLCERIVRPCGRECRQASPGIYGYWWSDGAWLPYVLNGEWRNCWCGCNGTPGCCGCQVDCQVLLDGPVNSIVSVTVDGVVIDPATYRVDNGIWLVRNQNVSTSNCWPDSQNYNVPSGSGTFFVNYLKGLEVPLALQRAAGELACEFAKACTGAACRLPSRATSLARQGVSISLVGIEAMLERGLTGISTVDQVIRVYNPYGLTGPYRIASLDVERTRETTWP